MLMIPEWNRDGALPHILPGVDASSPDSRSPYGVSPIELVDRFATNPIRSEILQGFFNYRAALNSLGIERGFQWINGSFVENVEEDEDRESQSPGDIDVVTFYYPPNTDFSEYRHIFDNERAKATYHVDAFGFQLDQPLTPVRVRLISYWYSMWSYRRNDLQPKGFLWMGLGEDKIARQALEEMMSRGVWR